jgi:hypothetical protein
MQVKSILCAHTSQPGHLHAAECSLPGAHMIRIDPNKHFFVAARGVARLLCLPSAAAAAAVFAVFFETYVFSAFKLYCCIGFLSCGRRSVRRC